MISLLRTVVAPSRQSLPPRHQLSLVRSCQSRSNQASYTPLLELVQQRRAQARRSILVQVAGPDSGKDLGRYCQTNFGDVHTMNFYDNSKNKKFTSFFIVEFSAEESVSQVLNQAQHSEGDGNAAAVPVYSPFLWFQSPVVSSPSHKAGGARNKEIPIDFTMKDRAALEQMVRHMSDPSEQMYHLWKYNDMTDTSLRIRWVINNNSLSVQLSLLLLFVDFSFAVRWSWPYQECFLSLKSYLSGRPSTGSVPAPVIRTWCSC